MVLRTHTQKKEGIPRLGARTLDYCWIYDKRMDLGVWAWDFSGRRPVCCHCQPTTAGRRACGGGGGNGRRQTHARTVADGYGIYPGASCAIPAAGMHASNPYL